jgi:molybdopterin synthase sulfur carrier subunit
VPLTFHLSGALRVFADGRDRIELAASAATVAEALEALWAAFPALRDRVATETGEIREHVNVFVGQENIRYTGGLATPVEPEAEISIFPAISGGDTFGDTLRERVMESGLSAEKYRKP